MAVTIFIVVVLLLLVILAGGVKFFYSLINPHSMHQENKTKALDVFVYLGIAISLITSVTNLLQILFTAIDRRFPDILSTPGYYADTSESTMRFAVASIVVMFPIYTLLSWYTSSDIKKFLYKQDIPVRKFMVYLTLFVTVLTLIGTLISVIYTYLGGELSVRFGYRALSVFFVALALFGYYYYALKRDYSKKTKVPVLITLASSVVVLIAVVWSVNIVGSPSVMRAKKIDSMRLGHISQLQQELLNKVNMKDMLPEKLDELTNAFQGFQVPVDPVTKEPYEYHLIQQAVVKMNYTLNKKELTNQAIFELCAVFETERDVNGSGMGMSEPVVVSSAPALSSIDAKYSAQNYYYDGDQTPFWNHGVGKTCFKRIITPEMYYGR